MKIITDYIGVVRGARRETRMFLLSTVAYWLGMGLVQLYLNFFLQGLGFDQSTIGLIAAAPQIAIVTMTLVIGFVSRKLGSWLTILIGSAIAGLALCVTAVSSEVWVIVAASLAMGLGGGLVWSNSGPFILRHSEEGTRATLFSLQAALGTLTGFFAYLGGGLLPGFLSGITGAQQGGVEVLRWILMIGAAFYFVSIVPTVLARPARTQSMPVTLENHKNSKDRKKRSGLLGSNPGLTLRLILPGTLVALGAGMTIPFMNLYIERKFNVSFAALGQLFAWTAVATTVALLLQPVLAAKVGKVKSVVLVQVGSLPFLLVLGYVEFFPLVAAALFVRAALMNMGNPVFGAYAMERMEEGDRATYASLASSSWSLGWASGSWISGVLRSSLGFFEGFALLFGLMAALYATSTIVMWVIFGREEEQRAQAPSGLKDEPALAA